MPRKQLPYGNTDGALTLDQVIGSLLDEEAVIEADTLSDLQNGPAPTAGRVAEVGQSDIYLGDGSQWVAASDVSWGSANNPIQDLEVVDATATGTTSGFGGGAASGVRYASDFSGADGGTQIQNAIDDLPADGGTVIVGSEGPDSGSDVTDGAGLYSFPSSIWLLTSTMTLPSETRLLFNGAYLVCQDGLDDNFIRNENARSGDSTRDSDIHVWGWPHATVHFNGGNRDDTVTNATRPEFNYNKVDRFSYGNLKLIDGHGWTFKPEDCETGFWTNIHLDHRGNAGNQDGIHPLGSRNLLATSMSGTCHDDWFALSNGVGGQSETDDSGQALDGFYATNINAICAGASNPIRWLSNGGAPSKNIHIANSTFDNSVSNNAGVDTGTTNVTGTPSQSDFRNLRLTDVNFEWQGAVFDLDVWDIHLNGVRIEDGLTLLGTNGADVKYASVVDCTSELQGSQTIQINGGIETLVVQNLDWYAASTLTSSNGDRVINTTSSANVSKMIVDGISAYGGSTSNDIINFDASGTFDDVDLRNLEARNGNVSILAGTIPDTVRWHGVRGGGPVGGIDLSTATGLYDRELAIADGTSTNANAGDFAVWDESGAQWLVHQHETTV